MRRVRIDQQRDADSCRAGLDTTVHGKGSHQFSKRTFHSLRYSFNSALANAGVSQEIRVKFTGHSSNAMNDRYTKLDQKPLGGRSTSCPSWMRIEQIAHLA